MAVGGPRWPDRRPSPCPVSGTASSPGVTLAPVLSPPTPPLPGEGPDRCARQQPTPPPPEGGHPTATPGQRFMDSLFCQVARAPLKGKNCVLYLYFFLTSPTFSTEAKQTHARLQVLTWA